LDITSMSRSAARALKIPVDRLPEWFGDNCEPIQRALRRYYLGAEGDAFHGRWFDRLAVAQTPQRLTAIDLVAVQMPSITVPPEASATLLFDETTAAAVEARLRLVPVDIDLWDVEESLVAHIGAADQAWSLLKELPGVGWVTAGKLLAAKRPRLLPLLDNDVASVVSSLLAGSGSP
jgi:hypothetical protein